MPLLLLAIAPSVSALSFPSLRTPHDVDFRSLGDLSIALGPQSASGDRASDDGVTCHPNLNISSVVLCPVSQLLSGLNFTKGRLL